MTYELTFAEEKLRGFAAITGVCAEALLNLPSERVIGEVRTVACALGLDWFDGIESTPELEQRYYDRFFVSAHPAFVPLFEDSVRSGYEENGRFRYAATDGRHFDHVSKCYRSVGFDFRLLEGCEHAVGALKPDSLACELAFMVYLAQTALELKDTDSAAAETCVSLLMKFAEDHTSKWVEKAAECLEAFDDDFYSRVVYLAADAIAAVLCENE